MPTFSVKNLATFHVLSDSGDGLRLQEENIAELIDISGFFDKTLDMSVFEPGRARITLEFERARDVDVRISWF